MIPDIAPRPLTPPDEPSLPAFMADGELETVIIGGIHDGLEVVVEYTERWGGEIEVGSAYALDNGEDVLAHVTPRTIDRIREDLYDAAEAAERHAYDDYDHRIDY